MIQTNTLATSKELFFNAEQAITHALQTGYPIAVWRHPNETKVSAIIDLKSQFLKDLDELEFSDPGFLINPFDQHHPSIPKHVRADLIYSWDPAENNHAEYHISPQLSATELETFMSKDPVKDKAQREDVVSSYETDFEEIVRRAIEELKAGTFSKVVLSRTKDIDLPEDFDLYKFFEKACKAYQNAFCYLTYTPEYGLWMGATPEALLSIDDSGQFQTMSLAGTQRLDDRSLQEIAWTQKEIEEQAMVSRYIIDCFKKIRLREFSEVGPRTSRAGNLVHLKTTYSVDMKKVGMEKLGSTMMQLLHPTSAVCGMPLLDALSFIKQEEKYNRELYAGFLGPVNVNQESRLYVNLRCMKIVSNRKARLFAGAGITEDSDPHKEFLETEMKINTLKKLFDR
ncbi:MAG: chorismate-binding protein [Cyclobacteriaceae bacterium]